MLKKPKEALRLKRLWQLKSEKRSYLPYLPYFPYFPYYSLHEARAFQARSRLKRIAKNGAFKMFRLIFLKRNSYLSLKLR